MLSLAELLQCHPSLVDLLLQRIQLTRILRPEQVAESTLHLQKLLHRLDVRVDTQLVLPLLNLIEWEVPGLHSQTRHLNGLISGKPPT